MTDENRIEEKHTCLCHSKGFRKFMTVAGGTFVGAFLAMSLFAALHKPPVVIPCPCNSFAPRMMAPCPCHHQFARPDGCARHGYYKHIKKDKFDRRGIARTEDKVDVEIDD